MKQLKFDWNWAQRKRWIDEAQIDAGTAYDDTPVSASAMAGMLNVINDHLGENVEAWPSQQAVAQKLKVSTKTVQRASQALAKKSLLIIENRTCKSGTQNFYRIVWTELQILEPSRRASWRDMLSGRRPSDSLTEPSDSLTEPSDSMSHEQTRTNKNKQQQPVATASACVATAPEVVVVSFEVSLDECGCFNSKQTLRNAREILRLSNSEIEDRITAYKALPEQQQRPGVLHNWLSNPRSYRQQPSEPVRQRRVDEKLEAGLRHTRMFKLLRSRLGRVPEDHEVEEALNWMIAK